MDLPKSFDITPSGKIVERAEIGQKGYGENIQYELQITISDYGTLIIQYYGEDGTFLPLDQLIKFIKSYHRYELRKNNV
jgi:hypothetical protein